MGNCVCVHVFALYECLCESVFLCVIVCDSFFMNVIVCLCILMCVLLNLLQLALLHLPVETPHSSPAPAISLALASHGRLPANELRALHPALPTAMTISCRLRRSSLQRVLNRGDGW